MTDSNSPNAAATRRVWRVAALCQAAADTLDARFNPITVQGEVTGFSRASSGHCYFSIKDDQAQIRCAMFRRAASLMNFDPSNGDQVELRGRLAVYEQRGDLQIVVESMTRAGQGSLFERFLQLKAKLEHEGLFDPARKRPLRLLPRGIGVVTSPGAAALQDVLTALRRRVPHVPVIVAPALVQGVGAGPDMVRALQSLYPLAAQGMGAASKTPVDVILLVRGGGSMEDLWAFNDEALARCIVQSPVPLVSGVGHETDFTLADFCADLRAPTPTAAAELCCQPLSQSLTDLGQQQRRLAEASLRQRERQGQRLDYLSARLGRPHQGLAQSQSRLERLAQRLAMGAGQGLTQRRQRLDALAVNWTRAPEQHLAQTRTHLDQWALRLRLLDPSQVLQRGYAWLQDSDGRTLQSVTQFQPGQRVRASLADGRVDLSVQPTEPN